MEKKGKNEELHKAEPQNVVYLVFRLSILQCCINVVVSPARLYQYWDMEFPLCLKTIFEKFGKNILSG